MSEHKGNTKISDYIPDTEVLSFEGFPESEGREFNMQTQIHAYAPYVGEKQIDSILARKVGDSHKRFEHNVETYEWTSGHIRTVIPKAQPKTRKEALDVVFSWLEGETNGKEHPWSTMESFMRYQHYTAQHGYDYIGCEIGANVAASNLSVAFTRGASKQYNHKIGAGNVRAWFLDFSLWSYLGMLNYSGNPMMYQDPNWLGSDNAVSSNDYSGQSVSATRRAYYMAYMAGVQWLISEAGGQGAFYATVEDDGFYTLSPHGEMFKEFYDFTQRHPDRGMTVVPFGVVIPHDHGLPFGHWNVPRAFETFELTDGDKMTVSLFDMFYPNSWADKRYFGSYDGKTETIQQVATPYGDSFDVLTQNAPQRVLNNYPVIILSGDFTFCDDDITRITEYVKQGGTLLLNTAFVKFFPEFKNGGEFGKGKAIVYGPDYCIEELNEIMVQLTKQYIPFEIEGKVQYIFNVKDGSVILTLINNEGVSKHYNKPVEIDSAAAQNVKIEYTGKGKVLEVRNILTDEVLPADKCQNVNIGPGDIAILEFIV